MNDRKLSAVDPSSESSSQCNLSLEDDLRERLADAQFKEGFGAELAKADVAIALYSARQASGLTQQVLADMIGSRQSYIAKLESGEANPTVGTVGRILAMMNKRLVVTAGQLLGADVPSKLTDVSQAVAAVPGKAILTAFAAGVVTPDRQEEYIQRMYGVGMAGRYLNRIMPDAAGTAPIATLAGAN